MRDFPDKAQTPPPPDQKGLELSQQSPARNLLSPNYLKKVLGSLMILAMICIVQSPCPAQAQSSYNYWGVPTQQLLQDLIFELGNIKKGADKMKGYELNFWALPYYSATNKQSFLIIQGLIEVQFGYTQNTSEIGMGLALGGASLGFELLPTQSNSTWINVNLRVLYNSYILLNAWQGNNWYELDPSIMV